MKMQIISIDLQYKNRPEVSLVYFTNQTKMLVKKTKNTKKETIEQSVSVKAVQ